MKKIFKTPLFYFNIALVVVIGLLITGMNANQTNLSSFAKKAIAAIQQITGQGELNKLAAFSGTNAIGNSQIFDNGTNVGIGTIVPIGKLHAVSDTAGDFIGISNSSVSSFAYMTQSGDIVGSGVGYANDFCTWSGKCLSAIIEGVGGGTGDNLGNHIATQSLNMNNNAISGGSNGWSPNLLAGGNSVSFKWNGSKLQYNIDNGGYIADIPKETITITRIRYSENANDLPSANCPAGYFEAYRDNMAGIYWGSSPSRYGSVVTLTCKKY